MAENLPKNYNYVFTVGIFDKYIQIEVKATEK